MSHNMKLLERVIKHRSRKEIHVLENQFSFMIGRSIIKIIYRLQSLMEKYQSKERNLHMEFIYMKKTYNRVSREIVWKALEKRRRKKKGMYCLCPSYQMGQQV